MAAFNGFDGNEKKFFLDQKAIDSKLKQSFRDMQNKQAKLNSPQSALEFLLSFVGGAIITLWLFFLMLFVGHNFAKAKGAKDFTNYSISR